MLDAVKAVVPSVDTSQLALGVLYVYPDNCGVHREVTFTAKSINAELRHTPTSPDIDNYTVPLTSHSRVITLRHNDTSLYRLLIRTFCYIKYKETVRPPLIAGRTVGTNECIMGVGDHDGCQVIGEWSDDLSLLVVPQVFRGLLREDGSASDVLPSSSSNSVMSKVKSSYSPAVPSLGDQHASAEGQTKLKRKRTKRKTVQTAPATASRAVPMQPPPIAPPVPSQPKVPSSVPAASPESRKRAASPSSSEQGKKAKLEADSPADAAADEKPDVDTIADPVVPAPAADSPTVGILVSHS